MKRMAVVFSTLMMFAATLSCLASDKPQEAQSILDGAMKQSKGQKKPIWLIFDASW